MNINTYGRQLLPGEIEANEHREFVGGLWDEMGTLQFEFLRARGLAPGHRLLDVGCGALRGGVHFVRHLDAGNYCGLDINASLLEAGRRELEAAGLGAKAAQLVASDRFEASRFGAPFDCAIAVSVFTHLPMNHIIRCLVEVRRVLRPDARFYASFFEAPTAAFIEPLRHVPGDIETHYDADPYHYAMEEIECMAGIARLRVERIGEWGHPRAQKMLAFALPAPGAAAR